MSLESINDKTKREYLDFSNGGRKEYIGKFMEIARESALTVQNVINDEVKKISGPTAEDMDMANLENDLYDFEHKGRSM